MRAGSVIWLAALILVGAVSYLLGRGDAPDETSRAPQPRESKEPSAEIRTEPSPAERPAVPAEEDSNLELTREQLQQLVGGTVSEARVRDAQVRARRLRERYLRLAKNADQAALEQVAAEIRKERAFLEDQARGGTMQLLRALREQDVRPFALVDDPTRFAKLFTRHTQGPTLDGADLTRGEEIPDGAVISFPAGVHRFGVRRFQHAKRFPIDLLVVGAGMDDTLLRLDELSTRHEIHSLTFRDLTIHCSDNYFTDLRNEAPAVIRLDRCRVIGFDMGAGGSVMLAARTAAFYATNCRIEAGFGRSPGSGNLFRVHRGLLVRLERCTIRGPFRSVFDRNRHATYVFEGCDLIDQFGRLGPELEQPPEGVRLTDCRVSYWDTEREGAWRKDRRRSLGEINPAWVRK